MGQIYERFNAFGDALGRKGLSLDRDRQNRIARCRDNLVRAAHWLAAHRQATDAVAAVLPGVEPGDDLVAFVEAAGDGGIDGTISDVDEAGQD